MANEMRTFVKVVSKDPRVATKLQEIFKFEKVDGKYEPDALDVINNIKGTDYSYSNESKKENWDRDVDFPDNDTWEEVIGPKWLYVEYDHQDEPENCNIVLRTAWSVPIPFLETLTQILTEIDEDCYIRGTYEDESYDPCGAFIYAKDYDDMEDYDDVYDWEEADADDFYTERWNDMLFELEEDLVNAYLDYVKEMEENPK
jgi:hypothetical protein